MRPGPPAVSAHDGCRAPRPSPPVSTKSSCPWRLPQCDRRTRGDLGPQGTSARKGRPPGSRNRDRAFGAIRVRRVQLRPCGVVGLAVSAQRRRGRSVGSRVKVPRRCVGAALNARRPRPSRRALSFSLPHDPEARAGPPARPARPGDCRRRQKAFNKAAATHVIRLQPLMSRGHE